MNDNPSVLAHEMMVIESGEKKPTVFISQIQPRAKCHVRVSKQSCKQANRLILWGVGAPQKKLV